MWYSSPPFESTRIPKIFSTSATSSPTSLALGFFSAFFGFSLGGAFSLGGVFPVIIMNTCLATSATLIGVKPFFVTVFFTGGVGAGLAAGLAGDAFLAGGVGAFLGGDAFLGGATFAGDFFAMVGVGLAGDLAAGFGAALTSTGFAAGFGGGAAAFAGDFFGAATGAALAAGLGAPFFLSNSSISCLCRCAAGSQVFSLLL
mmetsp:Transcript_18003/g.40308  ORF Transcript_18003/g.40308 Transcript_18003/m.40308 type:complete len:201 (+) Transcript_18003:1255-1857(+)